MPPSYALTPDELICSLFEFARQQGSTDEQSAKDWQTDQYSLDQDPQGSESIEEGLTCRGTRIPRASAVDQVDHGLGQEEKDRYQCEGWNDKKCCRQTFDPMLAPN